MSSEIAPINGLARVEGEIHQQTAPLSNLRAKRNFLLPVFRLPPETLATIFTHGARDYYEGNSGGHFTPCTPTWVNVSYVCSHWRNIALTSATLWAYHFNTSLRWTEELLLRSKQAPLKISCICTHPLFAKNALWSGFLDRLLKHSERIQELRLCLLPWLLPPKLLLRAPHLEKLEIKVCWRDDSVQCMVIAAGGDKPRLHTLKLINCTLPWYSLNLSGLKTLSLRGVRSPSQPNMAELLTILSGMRDLTVLHLEDVLPSARGFLSSGGLGISPKFDLPHLTRLAIAAPLSTVVALLSYANIPLKAHLSLELQSERGCSVDDYHSILSFITQRFNVSEGRSSSDLAFRSLIIDSSFAPRLTFSTLERDCEPRSGRTLDDWSHDIPLEVILGLSKPEETEEMEETKDLTEHDIHRIMSDICCSLPLTNVQSLHVIQPEFASVIWTKILGCLDGLRYMKLSDACMPDLSILSSTAAENLNGQRSRDHGATPGHIFVPALEELELYRIMFIPECGMSEQALVDALSTRKGLRDRLITIECEVHS